MGGTDIGSEHDLFLAERLFAKEFSRSEVVITCGRSEPPIELGSLTVTVEPARHSHRQNGVNFWQYILTIFVLWLMRKLPVAVCVKREMISGHFRSSVLVRSALPIGIWNAIVDLSNKTRRQSVDCSIPGQ